jgi:hypothetical protein
MISPKSRGERAAIAALLAAQAIPLPTNEQHRQTPVEIEQEQTSWQGPPQNTYHIRAREPTTAVSIVRNPNPEWQRIGRKKGPSRPNRSR